MCSIRYSGKFIHSHLLLSSKISYIYINMHVYIMYAYAIKVIHTDINIYIYTCYCLKVMKNILPRSPVMAKACESRSTNFEPFLKNVIYEPLI